MYQKADAMKYKQKNSRGKSTQKRPWHDLPESLHPKQRIFLSIDIIGSTSIKSELVCKDNSQYLWANSILAFLPEVEIIYRSKFIEMVEKHCSRDHCKKHCIPSKKKNKAKLSAMAKVWKYIGDEVVLVAELTCKEHQPALHILALAETVKHFNSVFSDKDVPLSFKGTAWVAAFPVTNIEIELPNQDNKTLKDYLGPSIDLGFRLAKYSTKERLMMSASLAYLITNSPPLKNPVESNHSLPLCFGGTAELKGVKNGRHPLIWYSINQTLESDLCRIKNNSDLLGFIKTEHFKENEILPFIFDKSHADPKYDEMYKKAIAEQKKIPNSVFSIYFKQKRKNRSKMQKLDSTLDQEALIKLVQQKKEK